eukprot:TRINITY_DN655_c0_g1_i1.p1 TRINITY_DN655_c0_g1~~TRINITY_DN655_c0_g1_i1.p1  ORF type:complete len:549 (-),score=209.13 TRINITY_DN655_c0_g1_i1:77-1723(-)
MAEPARKVGRYETQDVSNSTPYQTQQQVPYQMPAYSAATSTYQAAAPTTGYQQYPATQMYNQTAAAYQSTPAVQQNPAPAATATPTQQTYQPTQTPQAQAQVQQPQMQMQQPMQQPPMQQTPMQQTPMQQPPMQQTPMQQPPMQQTPMQQTPMQQPPMQQTPMQQPPMQQHQFPAAPRGGVRQIQDSRGRPPTESLCISVVPRGVDSLLNIGELIREREAYSIFERYGELESLKATQGAIFVNYRTEGSAIRAFEDNSLRYYKGHPIQICFGNPPRSKANRLVGWVPVGIEANDFPRFEITRRILGSKGYNFREVSSLSGARVTLKGIGSGFKSSRRSETDPAADSRLHVEVTALDEWSFKAGLGMINELMIRIRQDCVLMHPQRAEAVIADNLQRAVSEGFSFNGQIIDDLRSGHFTDMAMRRGFGPAPLPPAGGGRSFSGRRDSGPSSSEGWIDFSTSKSDIPHEVVSNLGPGIDLSEGCEKLPMGKDNELKSSGPNVDNVLEMLATRDNHRSKGEFEQADKLRDYLKSWGIQTRSRGRQTYWRLL